MSSNESVSETGLSGIGTGGLERLERRELARHLRQVAEQSHCPLTLTAAYLVECGDPIDRVLIALVTSLSADRSRLLRQSAQGLHLTTPSIVLQYKDTEPQP